MLDDALTILMQIPMVIAGIIVLFFVYGVKVQKHVVHDQMIEAASFCFRPLQVFLSESDRKSLKESLKESLKKPSPQNDADDAKIAINNAKLERKIVIFIGAMFLFFSVVIGGLLLAYHVAFPWHSLLNAVVITACVMAIEFLFMQVISSQYKVIDIQFIYNNIVKLVRVEPVLQLPKLNQP